VNTGLDNTYIYVLAINPIVPRRSMQALTPVSSRAQTEAAAGQSQGLSTPFILLRSILPTPLFSMPAFGMDQSTRARTEAATGQG